MPRKVSKGTDNLSYIYSASGAKLAKLKNGAAVNYYTGSLVYKLESGAKKLDYIIHPEGMVLQTETGLAYQYHLKDHLGNTRVVFGANGAMLQQTDYYAFGMSHLPLAASNSTKYLYNGKELQDDLIGGIKLDWYDYGARFYDPTLGRFHTKDPLMEWHFRQTPYHYCLNNPLRYTDPYGLDTIPANDLVMETYNPEEDVVALDEVTVTGKRPSWLKRVWNRIKRAGVASDNSLQGTPDDYDEVEVESGVDMSNSSFFKDRQQEETPVLSKDNPNFYKTFKNKKNTKAPKETSDREIVEQHTGSAEKTDADGRPIQEATQSQ